MSKMTTDQPMNRVQLEDALRPMLGYEETAYALAAIDEYGSSTFDRHHASGTDTFTASYDHPGRYYLTAEAK